MFGLGPAELVVIILIVLIFLLIPWLICAYIAAKIAAQKGQNFWVWLVLGLFFGFVTLIFALVISNDEKDKGAA